MLEVRKGQVYYEGKLLKDPIMIGFAFLDFAEKIKEWKQREEYTNTQVA